MACGCAVVLHTKAADTSAEEMILLMRRVDRLETMLTDYNVVKSGLEHCRADVDTIRSDQERQRKYTEGIHERLAGYDQMKSELGQYSADLVEIRTDQATHRKHMEDLKERVVQNIDLTSSMSK